MKQSTRRTAASAGALALLSLALAPLAQAKGAARSTHPPVKITSRQAVRIAKAKYPGKIVGKTILENEEGKWQYAVNVRSGKTLREIMVDANTGQIVDAEVTTAAKEAKEARDEARGKGEKGEAKEK